MRLSVLWRRARQKAKQVLNIDDNAKEVEDDVVEINPEDIRSEVAATKDVETDKPDNKD